MSSSARVYPLAGVKMYKEYLLTSQVLISCSSLRYLPSLEKRRRDAWSFDYCCVFYRRKTITKLTNISQPNTQPDAYLTEKIRICLMSLP